MRNPASMHAGGNQATTSTNITSRLRQTTTIPPKANIQGAAAGCVITLRQRVEICKKMRTGVLRSQGERVVEDSQTLVTP